MCSRHSVIDHPVHCIGKYRMHIGRVSDLQGCLDELFWRSVDTDGTYGYKFTWITLLCACLVPLAVECLKGDPRPEVVHQLETASLHRILKPLEGGLCVAGSRLSPLSTARWILAGQNKAESTSRPVFEF